MSTNLSTSGFAPVYRGKIYYEVAGSGPAILFIHAGVADSSMWDDQFSLFSRDFKVIRYDTRGFGKSRTDTTDFSNRQDIIDLLDFLGVDKVAVIGISRGGQIAIDFTLEHPERVTALIPVAAGVSGFNYQPGESEQAKAEFEFFNHMEELWENNAFDELADLEAHVWVDGPSQTYGRGPSDIRNYVHDIVQANYTRQDGKASAQVLDPPASDRLSEIKVPTLILVGEFDALSALAMADWLEKHIPGAHKEIIASAAHMVSMEQPELFNRLVLSFLKSKLAA